MRMLLGGAVVALFAGGGAQLTASVVAGASGHQTLGAAGSSSVQYGGRAPERVVGTATRTLPATTTVAYSAPVTPMRVVHAFAPPSTRYGAGHLGVDLASTTGEEVRAAADGVVAFAGSIAGRGVVVVLHADGVRTEYEPLRVSVHRGASVVRGQRLGVVRGAHGACPLGKCLHWGARRGTEYFDPLTLLRPLGSVRLLPWR